MRFGWSFSLTFLLVVLTFAPAAEAGLIPKHSFQVGIDVLDFDRDREGNASDLGLTLMTGAVEATGTRHGLYGFVNIRKASFSGIEKIEVINPYDPQGALARALQGACDTPDSCMVEKTVNAPIMSLLMGSSLIFYANETRVRHAATAPFGLSLLVQPPDDIGGGALAEMETEQSTLLMGDQLVGQGSAEAFTDQVYVLLPNNSSSLTLIAGDETHTYTGNQVVFRLHGTPAYEVSAEGILSPFQGDTEIRLAPSPGSVLREQFNLDAVNDVFASFGSNRSVVRDEVAQNFEQIAPILNGVLFGAAWQPVVNDEVRDDAKLALIRFTETTVRPRESGGAIASGRTDFLMFGTAGFYTDKTGTDIGFLRVPALAWILWILAAGAIVAGFMLKPIVGASQVGAFGAVRLVGLLFHALAFVLAFILWDFEIRNFLGTSLITIFVSGGGGEGVMLLVTATFQLVPFGAAAVLFGLPVRFMVNNGLKLGGLKKAGGIGKGIGNLAIWGLGAPFIPFFLNGVIQPLLGHLQQALP